MPAHNMNTYTHFIIVKVYDWSPALTRSL